jgi:lysophospholipase L1-like esterase
MSGTGAGAGIRLVLGGARPFTPAAVPNLLAWIDALDASRYDLSGSDLTAIRLRAGSRMGDVFTADPATTAPAADGSVVCTIGNAGTDLLAGKPCIKLATNNTTMLAPGAAARGTGSYTCVVLCELTAYVGAADHGAMAFFGQRYVASPLTEKNSGWIGQAGSSGFASGGGVSAGTVVHTTPTGSAILKTNPSVRAVRRISGGATSLWYDGVADGSATVAHNIAHTGLGIGRAGGYPCPTGRIYAALWFDRDLTNDEIADVTSYLLRAYRVGYTHVAGDSIAAGVGTITPATDGWVAKCQADLRATYGFGMRVNNTAVSGRTTQDVLDELPAEIVAIKSGLFGAREEVWIAAGSNDLATAAPAVPAALAAAKVNLAAAVALVQSAGLRARLVEVLARGDWNADAQSAAIDATYEGEVGLNAWMRSGAAWGTGSITFSDDVHPDNGGAETIGEFVAGQRAPTW